jgi:hypothetical protein
MDKELTIKVVLETHCSYLPPPLLSRTSSTILLSTPDCGSYILRPKMYKTIICTAVLIIEVTQADFGIWRIQESNGLGDGTSAEYPLLTDGTVGAHGKTGSEIYNWWKDVSHWYDLECDGCSVGDAIDHPGGKLKIGESSRDAGKRLLFESTQEGPGKEACRQIFGISCDYTVKDESGSQIGGCEFGGHSLSFTENLAGVASHLDGFRHLYCVSNQLTPQHP